MISMRNLIKFALENKSYIWIDVILVKETPKAILIMFDGRKTWIPKAWLHRIKRHKSLSVIAGSTKADKVISMQLSEYHWVKKIW